MSLGPRLLFVKEMYISIHDCLFWWKEKGLVLILDLFCETNEDYNPVATHLMNQNKQMTNLQQPFEEGALLGTHKFYNYTINALICR